jgi:4-hydroxy-2-oxoheptanedioate aldolase
MKLPQNGFKAALAQGSVTYGMWAGFAGGYASEIIASLGYDWMLIDGEHAPNDVRSILAQLQATAPYATNPVVRAINGQRDLIKQLLDIGAQTLMVPMVESGAQARALVEAMRYPPAGIRGVGGGLTRASRWGGVANYLEVAHQELCLIVQIESADGVMNVADVVAVDGVDAVFVGPADLSSSLGHPGNPSHPEVQAQIKHVLEVAKAAGKACGILAPVEEDARRYAEWGFNFIAVGIDICLLRDAALANLRKYKATPESKAGSTY